MSTKNIKKGSILLARPSLNLDIFHRSVIFITEHSDHGTVGFILNKKLEFTIDKFFPAICSNSIIRAGGPVETKKLFFLHNKPHLIERSLKITNDIYWSANINDIINAMNNKLITNNDINFYLGYCGWASKQLDEEIKDNAWEVINNEQINIYKDWEHDLWKNLLKKLGGENLMWLNTPSNPSMN